MSPVSTVGNYGTLLLVIVGGDNVFRGGRSSSVGKSNSCPISQSGFPLMDFLG